MISKVKYSYVVQVGEAIHVFCLLLDLPFYLNSAFHVVKWTRFGHMTWKVKVNK